MNDAVIVSAVRTPAGRAPKGVFKDVRPDELAAVAVAGCLANLSQNVVEHIDDVILGCAFPELEQGFNVARTVAVRAGLPYSAAGMTVNRFCSSGLQAIAAATAEIAMGWADVVIAGGVESMSMIPMGGMKMTPNPYLMEQNPGYYLAMGLTAEQVATRYGVTRQMQDEFAYSSCQKAEAAIATGRLQAEISPVMVSREGRQTLVAIDELKKGATLEGLAALKPVFKLNGTVTAGNASPMSDGASAVMIMSEKKAQELGARPLGRLKSFAVVGVEPEVMGIGPIKAIPKALQQAGLSLKDIGLIELNEAFAAQAVACINTLGINPEIVNVNGGAIALGHPLGCTGAKLTTTLLHEMTRRKVQYGIVSMCIGGGMGAAGVFERL
ncbi:MAG: acetyl-CoA acetyltransferase [Anaerosporomusa subterranea]|jgi:acetyl-CoA acyltransferase|nr:acetyl-CoA acetyltransferase [Anaerosporomusa subterranea]